jgi:hypothetical protein
MDYQISRNEIYDRFVKNLIFPFRYIDDVFMTANQTEEQIEEVLEKTSWVFPPGFYHYYMKYFLST